MTMQHFSRRVVSGSHFIDGQLRDTVCSAKTNVNKIHYGRKGLTENE